MKKLIAPLLTLALFAAAVFATNTQFETRIITSAAFTVNVKTGQYMTIRNFTQTQTGSASQRGAVIADIFPTPVPTPTPTGTPTPTPTPTLSTSASPAFAVIGSTLNDTATLSGDNNPNGTITFTLFDPNSNPVYTDVVTVTGNANYTTSEGTNPGGFMSSVAGTYMWLASYTGDTNGNSNATDNGENETVIVTSTPTPTPTPAPTPTPTPTPINTTVLTAAITGASPAEFVRPIVIAGPAIVTVNPVLNATLTITYRKFDQPSGSPTPTPTITTTTSATTTTTATSSATSGSSGSDMIFEALPSNDGTTDLPTPTPMPTTPEPVATSTPTPTPTATPLITPTPTPTP